VHKKNSDEYSAGRPAGGTMPPSWKNPRKKTYTVSCSRIRNAVPGYSSTSAPAFQVQSCLAMTFPFVIAALFSKPFLAWAARNRKYLGYVEKIMGVMLILFAVLIATDSINDIADFMIRNVAWFSKVG